MKKIILFLIILFGFNRVYAIENISINNENLSPIFDSQYRKYNYYTNEDKISIKVTASKDEIVSGYGVFEIDSDEEFVINSDKYGEYIIKVYKNYQKSDDEVYLSKLYIENYDINFNKNIHEYKINIDDESNLNINYELSNDNGNVLISGNGNFNKSDNIIKINVNNSEEYIIHALKSINVSKIDESYLYEKELSPTKKGIVKIIIITISSLLIVLYYKITFYKT